MVTSSDLGGQGTEVQAQRSAGTGELGRRLGRVRRPAGQGPARLPTPLPVLPGAGLRVRAPPERGSRAWPPPCRCLPPGSRLQSAGRVVILVTAPRGLGVRVGRPWLSEKAHARPGRGFLASDNLGGASVGAGPSCFPQALPGGAGGRGPKEGPEEGVGERRSRSSTVVCRRCCLSRRHIQGNIAVLKVTCRGVSHQTNVLRLELQKKGVLQCGADSEG